MNSTPTPPAPISAAATQLADIHARIRVLQAEEASLREQHSLPSAFIVIPLEGGTLPCPIDANFPLPAGAMVIVRESDGQASRKNETYTPDGGIVYTTDTVADHPLFGQLEKDWFEAGMNYGGDDDSEAQNGD